MGKGAMGKGGTGGTGGIGKGGGGGIGRGLKQYFKQGFQNGLNEFLDPYGTKRDENEMTTGMMRDALHGGQQGPQIMSGFDLEFPTQLPPVSINPTNAPLPEEETDEDIPGGVPGFDPMKRLSRNIRNSGNIY